MDRIGSYEIQGWVTRTPTGGLCRARDVWLDRVVALKQVADPASDAAQRLRGEARILAGLEHPHIVSVFELLEDASGVWLAQEWVDGAELLRVVGQAGRLRPQQALGVIRAALQALAFTHDRGIVHGDVTLSNILVGVDGVSKLVDFGLARPAVAGLPSENARPRGVFRGTPGLASPQVVAGVPATPADDVYSAGAVLASLLLGRAVFTGPTAEAVLAAQFHSQPDLRPITPQVRTVLATAMAPDPTQRYPSAGPFLASLEQAAQQDHGPGWLAEAGLAAVAGMTGTGIITAVAGGSSSGGHAVSGGNALGATVLPLMWLNRQPER